LVSFALTLAARPVPEAGGLPATLRFKFPGVEVFVPETSTQLFSGATSLEWLRAVSPGDPEGETEFGSRVVLQTHSDGDLQALIEGRDLAVARELASNVWILQATDARTAAREAHRLAAAPAILTAYPVIRRKGSLHGPYAAQPKDSLYSFQWYLEHRNADGSVGGPDVNVRAAWPFTRGEGVTIAVGDTGVELRHVELADRTAGQPHYNFADSTTNAEPVNNSSAYHGTAVAGLAAATLDNARMTGVAPKAGLASWVVFHTNSLMASDEELMNMFQSQTGLNLVQNHSWGHEGGKLTPLTLLEDMGISNAIALGRSGRGAVIVRSAGNGRASGVNANDDGYTADPRVVTVGAVRLDGRVASYSQYGASLLVAAPSGDSPNGFDGLFTTDLSGVNGLNQIGFFPPYADLNSYLFNSMGFSGTSAATPLVSGVAALILSANPGLTWRDAQQVLALSARHFDFADPDLQTNGAGLRVSHNAGFGVPDAGEAVSLARRWQPRAAAKQVVVTRNDPIPLMDGGVRVVVTGPNLPPGLESIPALHSRGIHVEGITGAAPIGDFGYGTNAAGFDVTNKAALMQRDSATYTSKLTLAAAAGARFGIFYNIATNNGVGAPGGDYLLATTTEFVPIPAVFIGHDAGETLKNLAEVNPDARVQISVTSGSCAWVVTNQLSCEHVQLRVMTDHQRRGDLRITLVSPAGTRSVLQQYSFDNTPGPTDWTYYSTHHLFEPSAGTWTASFTDESPGSTGSVRSVSLILDGAPIVDTDADGLDDNWEMTFFSSLALGPRDDPDHDGFNNAREQGMGTNPARPDNLPPIVDLSSWNPTLDRLSWAGSPDYAYEIWRGDTLDNLTLWKTVPGTWPQTEASISRTNVASQFFRVRPVPNP
jgi:subtilisin family serine protease